MSEQMKFADGKYTVINDNGTLTALRHGEPLGRDLTGDNLVYWMLIEALELKRQRDELLKALKSLINGYENIQHTGLMDMQVCGSDIINAFAVIAKATQK